MATEMNGALATLTSSEVFRGLQTVRSVLAPDLSDDELRLFAMVAARSGLDPWAKQVFAIKRAGRVTFQTSIEGYRSIAERTGEYDGSDEPEFGEMVNGHPESATVTVYRWRNGHRVGQRATAWWSEFYPGDSQGQMWKKMPRNQLAKCAEALAMRKAFPYVLADIYTPEEMEQAGPGDNAPLLAAAAKPTAAERIAARRQSLDQASASVEEGGEALFVEGTASEVEAAPLERPETPAPEAAATERPSTAPRAAAGGPCGAGSPYDDLGGCAMSVGHAGKVHRSVDADGVVVATWPVA